jgi:hypothetical protein
MEIPTFVLRNPIPKEESHLELDTSALRKKIRPHPAIGRVRIGNL